MKQKFLSVLLVLALALTLLPTAAFAAPTDTESGTTGAAGSADAPKFTTVPQDASLFSKTVSTFQNNIQVDTVTDNKYPVTGTVKYVTDWTQFNEDESEQTGFYVALSIPGSVGEDTAAKDVTGMKLPANGGQDTKEYTGDGLKAVFTDGANKKDCYVAFFLGATADAAKAKTITIGLKYGEEATDYANYTFSFAGLTCEDAPTQSKDPAVTITESDVDVILGNFNAELTGTNKPYTGTPSIGTPKFAAATQTAPITITVEPTVDGLKAHPTTGTATSGDMVKPWVGIGVPRPADGVTVKYYAGWGDAPLNNLGTEDTPDNTQVSGEKTYNTFYWGVTAENKAANKKGYLVAVYSADNKADVTVLYVLDFKNVTLADTTPAAGLTFGAIPNNKGDVVIYGKKIANLGAFAFTTDGTTIKVTGSANYIKGYTEFSSIEEEQKGHYLPIQIKGTEGQKITITGNKTKELTFKADGSFELIMRLDDIFAPVEARAGAAGVGKFTVKLGTDGPTYTIDCTGITLADEPEVEDGKTSVTVEATDKLADLIKGSVNTGTGDTADENAPVKVEGEGSNKTLTFAPKTEGDGGTMESVDKAEVTLPSTLVSAVTTGTDTKADVKVETTAGSVTVPSETLSGQTGAVTLKVETPALTAESLVVDKTGESGTEAINQEVATAITTANGVTVTATGNSGNSIVSAGKPVTVTIVNLDISKTYVVFCIANNKVTLVGKTKPSGSGTISVETPHLTSFVATPEENVEGKIANIPAEPAANGAVIKNTGSDTPTTSAKYTVATVGGSIGKKYTIAGSSGKFYIIQVSNNLTAPGAIYCQQAPTDGSVVFYANGASTVKIWEADAASAFTGGIPSGLAEVTKA